MKGKRPKEWGGKKDFKKNIKKAKKNVKKGLTDEKGRGIIYKLTRERRTESAKEEAGSTLKNEQQAKRKMFRNKHQPLKIRNE